MLSVKINKKYKKPNEKLPEYQDIIITKVRKESEYENGKKIEKMIPKKVNVTKLVNESAKIIKQETAEDVIKKMADLLNK